ncbi:MAG: ATP-binding cassette domain-containing protein [Curvibacter sp.]|nr:MAG: ATP-binding cassette domain-containing protein [Curvibacter sp.]
MSLRIHIAHLATPTATLVRGLDLTVDPGTVHTLMGESGSGKSSVLAAVCGTLADDLTWSGQVTLNGQRIDTLPTQARKVGILFQEDLLFAHMTVRENLLFAVPPGPQPAREAAVVAALADVEMGGFLHANPATLSGGQRARVALARALLAQPRALLLDEPFSKLDAALRERMRSLVFGLVRSRQIPALLVTHDSADIASPAHLTHLKHLDRPGAL